MAAQPNPIVLGYIEIIFFLKKKFTFYIIKSKYNTKTSKNINLKKRKKIKIHNFFKRIFETQKETCFNKEIQLNLK